MIIDLNTALTDQIFQKLLQCATTRDAQNQGNLQVKKQINNKPIYVLIHN